MLTGNGHRYPRIQGDGRVGGQGTHGPAQQGQTLFRLARLHPLHAAQVVQVAYGAIVARMKEERLAEEEASQGAAGSTGGEHQLAERIEEAGYGREEDGDGKSSSPGKMVPP